MASAPDSRGVRRGIQVLSLGIALGVAGLTLVGAALALFHRRVEAGREPIAIAAVVTCIVGGMLMLAATVMIRASYQRQARPSGLVMLSMGTGSALTGIGQAVLSYQLFWIYGLPTGINTLIALVWAMIVATPAPLAALVVSLGAVQSPAE